MLSLGVELDDVCMPCFGRGWRVRLGEREVCEHCEGVGYIPTGAGQELLEFIQRHLSIKKESTES